MLDKISLMNRARLQKRCERDMRVRKTALELFERQRKEPLFISGVVLYWAEGTRLSKNYRKYQLAFTNSDSNLLSFYCVFLEKYFKNIDNIEKKDWRAGLFLYPDINTKQAISYWSKVIGIPEGQFIKPQILEGKNSANGKLKFGTCCIYINSKDACVTMQTWMEAVNAAVIQR